MSDEKKKRSAAKGRFTRIANNLEKCITDPNGDGDDVQQTFGDLESAWKNVEIKHEEYISTLDENANFQPEETWIDEIEKKYRNISDNTRKEENQKWLKILIDNFGSVNSIADKYILGGGGVIGGSLRR